MLWKNQNWISNAIFFKKNVYIMLRNTNHVCTKIKNIFEKTDIGIH